MIMSRVVTADRKQISKPRGTAGRTFGILMECTQKS
jgi:hypothetical protein